MELQYSTAYFQKLDLLEELYLGQASLREMMQTKNGSARYGERFEQIEEAIVKLNKEIRILERHIIQSVDSVIV
ncbi:hypothetical protein [Lysinibacillus pakistanensis]|uniref:Uncharacterized protein n=1 Tax=Lysinibacillus pakistanensis TaxID=759811 RepID=A0AAX3X3W4_9BACI|nr:hypothetical protein [Lysinibacillus pakistanensis]MDM5233242.1 hypothetical protein [Lysinibacillus pakistanensis]WHY48720.1 hypothetical protein QNH22_11020 [Lysinibacillus pakistanensis]WHY53733.1 hypothetical protein QNH24_11000 [Lysinibacillus pakistanensis]